MHYLTIYMLCLRCNYYTISNTEQLFLQFITLEDITGKGISVAIIGNCNSLNRSEEVACQEYDGAAILSGI